MRGLLAVLAGRHIDTSYGGDPIKNPDAYPTGRNLYGFDPSRVSTQQAWAAGKEAAEQLIAEHRRLTGQPPKKLAVSLWSVETMRHQGLLEAQALWLLGTEPVWDEGGRVTGVKLVPRGVLGRERVDVVLSATGLYRDHFPNTMKILAQAAQLAAQAEGPGEEANPVAAHTRAIAARLRAQGLPDKAAQAAAETRIYSSESGKYGTGLDDATLATDTWKGKQEGDRKLAQLYLSRMQFAYGADESTWGSLQGGDLKGQDGQPLNLYAEHEFNASTFTSRVIAGTGSDMYSCIAGAIGALRGPKHGGANIKVVSMFQDLKKNVKDISDEEEVREYLKKLAPRHSCSMPSSQKVWLEYAS